MALSSACSTASALPGAIVDFFDMVLLDHEELGERRRYDVGGHSPQLRVALLLLPALFFNVVAGLYHCRRMQSCEECERLWHEYAQATTKHIQLCGKQRMMHLNAIWMAC
jgi:hypothetical protein